MDGDAASLLLTGHHFGFANTYTFLCIVDGDRPPTI
jgi:hypothetical protein